MGHRLRESKVLQYFPYGLREAAGVSIRLPSGASFYVPAARPKIWQDPLIEKPPEEWPEEIYLV